MCLNFSRLTFCEYIVEMAGVITFPIKHIPSMLSDSSLDKHLSSNVHFNGHLPTVMQLYLSIRNLDRHIQFGRQMY